MSTWNDLTMQERADVISMAVKAGLRDIDSIRSFYAESTKQDNKYEIGGPIKPRRSSNGNRFATMTDAELEAPVKATDEYWEQQQQAPSIAKSPEEVEAEFREAYPKGHEASSDLQHMSNLFTQATEQQFPITAEGYREAINNQVEEKVNKWKDYKKGVEAAVTATELGLSGASLLGSYANWRNWANAVSATKRGIANLLQRAQLPMQIGGTLIDGAQTYMALQEGDDFNAKYNGISAGLGTAGSVGASDVFLNSRFHNQKIDRVLDVLGIIQNAGDFLKFGYDNLLGGDGKE